MEAADRLFPSVVREHLATATFGRRLYYYPEVGSTNDIALALARGGEGEGTIVLTDGQHRGRGRHGRSWSDRPGRDLLFSLVLRPDKEPQSVLPVTLVISLAISVALSRVTGGEVGVKWPNDLMASSQKIGGILAEASHRPGASEFVVVGIGINVNGDESDFPMELREKAISCQILSGAMLDRAAVLGEVLGMTEAYYQRFSTDGFAPLVSSYEGKLVHRDRAIRFKHEGTAREADIVGVGQDGSLQVVLHESGARIALYNQVFEILK